MKKTCTVELGLTACHEAGHAVAAISLGGRFKYVTIAPKNERTGVLGYIELHMSRSHTKFTKSQLKNRIISIETLCAGVIVENKLFKRKLSIDQMNDHIELRRAIWKTDFLVGGTAHKGTDYSIGLSYESVDKDTQGLFNHLYLTTQKVLNKPKWWASIDHVARALIPYKTLNFKEVNIIISFALENYKSYRPKLTSELTHLAGANPGVIKDFGTC